MTASCTRALNHMDIRQLCYGVCVVWVMIGTCQSLHHPAGKWRKHDRTQTGWGTESNHPATRPIEYLLLHALIQGTEAGQSFIRVRDFPRGKLHKAPSALKPKSIRRREHAPDILGYPIESRCNLFLAFTWRGTVCAAPLVHSSR